MTTVGTSAAIGADWMPGNRIRSIAAGYVDEAVGVVIARISAAYCPGMAQIAGGIVERHMLGMATCVRGTVGNESPCSDVTGCTAGRRSPDRRIDRPGAIRAGMTGGRHAVAAVGSRSMFGNRVSGVIVRYINFAILVAVSTGVAANCTFMALATGGIGERHMSIMATGGRSTVSLEHSDAVVADIAGCGSPPDGRSCRTFAVWARMTGSGGTGTSVSTRRMLRRCRITVGDVYLAVGMVVAAG